MLWLIRHTTVITLLLAGGLAGVLFSLKYEVQALESELKDLNRGIAADRDAIHVLKAEWSHLNEPSRLRDLSQRHLDLKPMRPSQFGNVEDIPYRAQATAPQPVPDAGNRAVITTREGAR